MPMSTLNISLPEPLKTYIDAQIEAGDYGTPSEYVRDLILDDRDRHIARLEERLLDNLKSKPIAISDDELAQGNFVDLCRRKLQENR